VIDDLFGGWPPSPAEPIMGMKVRMDRARDLIDPCCESIAIIGQAKGPHAAALYCEHCWRWQAWLSKDAVAFLTETVRLFGVPTEPFSLCDATPGANPMKKSDALPSKYIRATDIGDGEWPLTIVQTRMEKVGQDDTKPVMRFKEISSGLVLNGTNWDTLATAYGEESDGWNGKTVILYAAETTMKGKPALGTRIKTPGSNTAAKPKLVAAAGGKSKPALTGAKSDLDDEIPF
jgi:hypothetical protein